MGNCLVTKLKAVVNNDELLELGEFEIKFFAPTQGNIHHQRFHTRGVSHLVIIGDAYFTDSTGTENYGKTKDIDITNEPVMYPTVNTERGTIHYVTGPTSIIRLKSKYDIGLLSGQGNGIQTNSMAFYPADLSVFKYCESFETLELSGWYNHGSYGKGTSPYPTTKGDINSLSGLVNLKTLAVSGFVLPSENINMPFDEVVGDIACLANLTKLISVKFNQSNVSGVLEDFLDGLHANGKISGTLAIDCRNTQVTYNGSSITSQYTATFTSEGWTIA